MKFKKIIILFIIIFTCAVYYNLIKEQNLPNNIIIDKILIIKSDRKLFAYSKGRLIKTYKISIGRGYGKKKFEGDNKTPEGTYYINDKNPRSSYYKNLGISYPNNEDIENARKNNLVPGSQIKIHGIRNGLGFIGKFHRWIDWTKGCIAITNSEMDELYSHTPIGTIIEIKP